MALLRALLTRTHLIGCGMVLAGWLLAGHLFLIVWMAELGAEIGGLNRFFDGGSAVLRQVGVWSFGLLYAIPALSGWVLLRQGLDDTDQALRNWAAVAAIILPVAVPFIAFGLITLGLPGDVRHMIFQGMNATGHTAAGHRLDLWAFIDLDFGWALMLAGGLFIRLRLYGLDTAAPKTKA